MQQTIINKLEKIEQEQKIKLLFACESGSRGWQFPSPDSDYDVRFIYVRPYSFYVSVINRKYDLNFDISDELDINGWDLRKVLQLIRKSNTTPFEWLQSPIVYQAEEGFKNDFWPICQHYFSQRANIHHYLGIARGALDTIMNENEIKIKKFFYVLRPLLAAKWCLDNNSIAPMTIHALMNQLPRELQMQVSELITLKTGLAESFVITINAGLQSYMDNEFARINEASGDLNKDYFEADELDTFFIKTIKQYDH